MGNVLAELRRTTANLLNKTPQLGKVESDPAKGFVLARCTDTETLVRLTESFARRLGPVEYESEPVAEGQSLFEGDDPGHGPLRGAAFEAILPAEKFPSTLTIEPVVDDRKSFTILSGIVTRDNVIIYFREPKPHRLSLGNGTYAELLLYFGVDSIETVPWTYEAFDSREFRDFCRRVRENLLG